MKGFGYELLNCTDLLSDFLECKEKGFSFVQIPLLLPTDPNLTLRRDIELSASQWKNVVGEISRDICMNLDHTDSRIRRQADRDFSVQVEWVIYNSLPFIFLPLPQLHQINFIKNINTFVSKNVFFIFQVRICDWKAWNQLRVLCDHSSFLSICLDLSDLSEGLERWLSEPLKCLRIPCGAFTKMNYLKRHFERNLLSIWDTFHPNILLENGTPSDSIKNISSIIEQQDEHEDDRLGLREYRDYLQFPLQPLADNLENQTYEIFECDPVKYTLYEEAIHSALLSLNRKQDICVMVVGAGRGPLVRAVLNVQEKLKYHMSIYAIEKNDNALAHLYHLKASVTLPGTCQLTIVHTDMRSWKPVEYADLIISELLGSFGDNELSPECLDGATRFLKPHGIMIPRKYSSYVAPLMSSQLFNKVSSFQTLKSMETFYVVKFKKVMILDEPQECFSFEHPNYSPSPSPSSTNNRYISLRFQPKTPCILHGFAGFFESFLFDEESPMSILPSSFSENMFSWFPLYIPIRNPITIETPCEIVFHIWRNSDNRRVWYEWSVTSPQCSPLHNTNGRSYCIDL